MSDVLVKRVDSAYMKRMFDMALENTDVNFLSATTNVSLEQVRNLKLDTDSKQSSNIKIKPKPPQPPKQRIHADFSLSSFESLLDGADAESWLVAPSFDENSFQDKPEALSDARKEIVSSPIESCVSSEIVSSSLTPASVLDTKQGSSKQLFVSESPVSEKSPIARFLTRPHSACAHHHRETQLTQTGNQDFRLRPRSVGSVNHTPAPQSKKKPPKAMSNIVRPKSSLERVKPNEDMFSGDEEIVCSKPKSRIPRLVRPKRQETSASPDAVSVGSNKTITRALNSLGIKRQPFSKSVGSDKQSRLPPLSPSPAPKLNESKSNKGSMKEIKRSLVGRKLASSVPPARPSSSLRKA